MDGVLSGLYGVAAYVDDIIITRKTEQEHLQNLDNVLTLSERANLRLNPLPSIQYLSHVISAYNLAKRKFELYLKHRLPTISFLGAISSYQSVH